MRIVPPLLVVCSLAAFGTAPAIAQTATPETDVARGIQQVRDGDFEGASVTLEAASAALKSEPGRSRPLLVQAYIHLGVAQVALDHEEAAQRAFREALALEPNLRLDTDRFSPKVVRTFHAAREAWMRERAAAKPSKGGRTALIVGGAAAVVAGGVVLATRGDEAPPATPTFRDARFGTPVLVCPDGPDRTVLSFTILVEARNPGSTPVTITDVTSTITIRSSPGFPGEVGFANSEPTEAVPAVVPPATNASVRLNSRIVCGNGSGDPPRFNEWSGGVTLTTSAGLFTLETADRMVINLP